MSWEASQSQKAGQLVTGFPRALTHPESPDYSYPPRWPSLLTSGLDKCYSLHLESPSSSLPVENQCRVQGQLLHEGFPMCTLESQPPHSFPRAPSVAPPQLRLPPSPHRAGAADATSPAPPQVLWKCSTPVTTFSSIHGFTSLMPWPGRCTQ